MRNNQFFAFFFLNYLSSTFVEFLFSFFLLFPDAFSIITMHLTCTKEAGSVCVLHGKIISGANTWLTAHWLYLLKCLLSCGRIERLSERWVQLGCFFLKGQSAGKGTACIRIEAKGPRVILFARCHRCSPHSHPFSVTLIFPLPLLSSANNLCRPPPYFSFLISSSLFL